MGMAGWSKEKREIFEKAFYSFLDNCFIYSKDYGRISLGQNLFLGQRMFITAVLDALEQDIHRVYVLKSRQLGLSTISRAMSVFYLGVHKGLRGALVFDTSPHKEQARRELVAMIRGLPAKLKFPKVKGTGEGNRDSLELVNESSILFMNGGVKKSKGSGTLGRSVGLSMAHLSELCSIDNESGLEAFEQSLSEVNPDRLYIYESTARGFNQWHAMWTSARKDPAHCKMVFLGWWSKDNQRIEKTDIDFAQYGTTPPTQKEVEKIRIVKEQYGIDISVEQLAWVRRKYDPTAQREGDADPEFEASTDRIQEQPWCVTKETRVGTANGMLKIADVRAGMRGTLGAITHAGATGRAVIWKARTKLGYEIRGTGNHPLINTANAPIRLDASLGTTVRLQPPIFAEQEYVYEWKEGVIDSSVRITPELARFVGIFMGDGSASASRGGRSGSSEVSICCDAKDTDVIDECVRLFDSLFGVAANRNPFEGWVTVRCGQQMVFQTIKKLGLTRTDIGKTMRHVHVPEFIWRSPKPVVREFLRGLFEADGYNAYETNRVALFSKWPAFIADVQRLLLAFGITSRSVSMKKKAGDGHFYTGNQLELRTAEAMKFNAEIGFISHRKRSRYNPEAYERMWQDAVRLRKRGNRKRPEIFLEDEIVSVVNEGIVDDVYNVTVEDCHLFDANGILTHNTEEDAFQQTGSIFFPAEKLTEITHSYVEPRYKTFMFITGAEFADMKVISAPNTKNIDLKVWEEPDPEGYYCIGVDPAFGENPNNDRSSIQVLRCYADGVDQVAEYASPLPSTHQFAWVLASILGWYGSNNAQVRYALELNGPGTAVFSELRSLKHQIETGYQAKSIEEKGLKDVFRNVRTLIYNRADSIGVGKNFHIKTNTSLKIMFMERMRDFVVNNKFRIRSLELLDEMKTIAREGDSIKAPGTMKDDRVLAASFAIYCWETGPRKQLVMQNRTREAEKARKTLSITDQVYLFQQNQLSQFFATKTRERVQAQRLAVRQSWRYR